MWPRRKNLGILEGDPVRKEAKREMEGKENETDFIQGRSEEKWVQGKPSLEVTVQSRDVRWVPLMNL